MAKQKKVNEALTRQVIGLPDARPWWLGGREEGLFAAKQSPFDGLARVSAIPARRPDRDGEPAPHDERASGIPDASSAFPLWNAGARAVCCRGLPFLNEGAGRRVA